VDLARVVVILTGIGSHTVFPSVRPSPEGVQARSIKHSQSVTNLSNLQSSRLAGLDLDGVNIPIRVYHDVCKSKEVPITAILQ
jgi:hypothetical protein